MPCVHVDEVVPPAFFLTFFRDVAWSSSWLVVVDVKVSQVQVTRQRGEAAGSCRLPPGPKHASCVARK